MKKIYSSAGILCLFFVSHLTLAQTYQTFDASTTNALTGSNWSAGSGTNACNLSGLSNAFTTGNIAYFCTSGGTGSGSVAISVGGIIVTENYTHTGGSDNTLETGGSVIAVDVASGKTFTFQFNWLSNTSGTGFIKNGAGIWTMTGSGFSSSEYNGGFTLNAGTVVARANSNEAFGNGPMVINGGTIETQGTYNWTPSGLTIGGNFEFTGSGTHNWNMDVSLGTSVRTITSNKTNGSEVFNGIISGSGGGISYTGNSATSITLTGANTYTGNTTVSGSTLILSRSGGGTLPSTNNCSVSGGTLQISSNQTLNNLTLTGGTLLIDDGVTLTINGTLSRSTGTTITLSGSGAIQYGASSILVYDGASSQTSTDVEWPASNGPASVTIGTNGVVLHSGRTLTGTLTLNGKLTLGTNNLILASGATSSGASTSNYVVTNSSGYLQRNSVTSSTDFPVGNSTYNPINISNSGTSDNFTVKVADEVLDGGTSGTALTTNAVDRAWTVTEGSAGNSNVTLTVQWASGDELGSFNRSSCYLSHFTGGIWVDNTAGSASGSDPYTISRSGITSFSPFGVGSGGALPVLLINLKAQKIKGGNLISWTTATEINNDYFSIEKKVEPGEYEEIGKITGNGNSNSLSNYSFLDENPIANSICFYRIVQNDYNGAKETFGPAIIKPEPFSSLSVSPNPFEDLIIIDLDDEIIIDKIIITNMIGEIVMEQLVEENNLTLNTENWKPGNYFITLTGPGYIKTLRHMKI